MKESLSTFCLEQLVTECYVKNVFNAFFFITACWMLGVVISFLPLHMLLRMKTFKEKLKTKHLFVISPNAR